jgi:hypothetical protein
MLSILTSKNNLLFILLLVSSLSVTSFFKQVSAIDSTSIINKGIETVLPLMFDYLKDRGIEKEESDSDTVPPAVESPTTRSENDPCDDPALIDLCGSEQSTVPYDPYASPYDPQLAMQQYWEQFESQLNSLTPEEKYTVLSVSQQMIEQQLDLFSPIQQQEAIQILQQTMSPELSEMLLPT